MNLPTPFYEGTLAGSVLRVTHRQPQLLDEDGDGSKSQRTVFCNRSDM